MKNIIAVFVLFFTYSIDVDFLKDILIKRNKFVLELQKITSQVIKNNPNITSVQAIDIARVILNKTDKHKIPRNIFTAILAQESMYKLSAKRCNFNKCTDLGISQIHHLTVNRYKFDKKLLLTDLNYSIEAGCIVLKDFMKRYGHKEKNWYSRYNSSNPVARKKYEKMIKRFL